MLMAIALNPVTLTTAVCIVMLVHSVPHASDVYFCAEHLPHEDSCYSEREVICNNYTDSRHDCIPDTVRSLSYGKNGYSVSYGANFTFSANSVPEVTAFKLCHREALQLTLSDLKCGEKCTSANHPYIQSYFTFACSHLPNLIYDGLTIVAFRKIESPLCSRIETKFVVIDTRG